MKKNKYSIRYEADKKSNLDINDNISDNPYFYIDNNDNNLPYKMNYIEIKKSFEQKKSSSVRVLYLASSILPLRVNGYSVRTHFIIKELIKSNIDVICVNKPIIKNAKINSDIEFSQYDNVTYCTLFSSDTCTTQKNNIYTPEYTKIYYKLLDKVLKQIDKPTIIHACSDYINPLVGQKLSKKLGIPLIYEIRGLWYLSRLSYDKAWEKDPEYKRYVSLENECFTKATHIFAISNEVKDEIISGNNGIKNKITVFPNCVDVDTWVPIKKNNDIINKYNLGSDIIIGYVGSIVNYEGIDYLIKAINILKKKNIKCKLFIVGKGTTNACLVTFNELVKLTKKINLTDRVIFTGDIPFDIVKEYYSVIDIICLPRKGYKVCEIVTPLKPFEAMAMEKALVVSNVNPLKNNVDHMKTGLVHEKDNYKDLAKKIELLINNNNLIKQLGINARKWIIENRKWSHVVKDVINTYNKITL